MDSAGSHRRVQWSGQRRGGLAGVTPSRTLAPDRVMSLVPRSRHRSHPNRVRRCAPTSGCASPPFHGLRNHTTPTTPHPTPPRPPAPRTSCGRTTFAEIRPDARTLWSPAPWIVPERRGLRHQKATFAMPGVAGPPRSGTLQGDPEAQPPESCLLYQQNPRFATLTIYGTMDGAGKQQKKQRRAGALRGPSRPGFPMPVRASAWTAGPLRATGAPGRTPFPGRSFRFPPVGAVPWF